jgi:hypothetical protein
MLTAACGVSRDPARARAAARPAGPSFAVTDQGYRFTLVLTALRKAPSASASDSGAVISTPPGRALILATLTYTNPTRRPEPWVAYPVSAPLGEDMPYRAVGFFMLVPRTDATLFGINPRDAQLCRTPGNPQANSPRMGYCDLTAVVVGTRPGLNPATGQVPQLAPRASATVTLAAVGPSSIGIPQSAPLKDVSILYAGSCARSAATPDACLSPLN